MPDNDTNDTAQSTLVPDLSGLTLHEGMTTEASNRAPTNSSTALSSLHALLDNGSETSAFSLDSGLCDHPSMRDLQAFRDEVFPSEERKVPNAWECFRDTLEKIAIGVIGDDGGKPFVSVTSGEERIALAVREVNDLLRILREKVEPALENPQRYGERKGGKAGAPRVDMSPVIRALSELQAVRLCIEKGWKVYHEHYANKLPGSHHLPKMLAHTEACAKVALEMAKAAAVCLEELGRMHRLAKYGYERYVPELKDVWKER